MILTVLSYVGVFILGSMFGIGALCLIQAGKDEEEHKYGTQRDL